MSSDMCELQGEEVNSSSMCEVTHETPKTKKTGPRGSCECNCPDRSMPPEVVNVMPFEPMVDNIPKL